MREIKFRAWDIEEEQMSESFGFGGNNSIDYKIPQGIHMIGKDDLDCVEIVLMQFTGHLTQIGKKEIYEGDIVTCMGGYDYAENQNAGCECPSVVQWDDERGQWFVFCEKCHESNPLFEYDLREIIGNIYQNPELLK